MNGKKTFLLLLTVLSIAITANSVQAVSSTSTDAKKPKQELRKEIANIKDEFKQATSSAEKKDIRDEVKAKKFALKTKLAAAKNDKLNNYLEKIQTEIDQKIAKLKEIYTKTETKIGEFEAKGINMSDSRTKLALAKKEIDSVDIKAQIFVKDMEWAVKATTASKQIENVRTMMNRMKTSLKTAHASMVNVISSIKASVKTDGSKNATSTQPAI